MLKMLKMLKVIPSYAIGLLMTSGFSSKGAEGEGI